MNVQYQIISESQAISHRTEENTTDNKLNQTDINQSIHLSIHPFIHHQRAMTKCLSLSRGVFICSPMEPSCGSTSVNNRTHTHHQPSLYYPLTSTVVIWVQLWSILRQTGLS